MARCPIGWKESLNGYNWELITLFGVTAWRKLAETVHQCLERCSQAIVGGELGDEARDGSQRACIRTKGDQDRNSGRRRASYEVSAHTVKFMGKRESNSGAPLRSGGMLSLGFWLLLLTPCRLRCFGQLFLQHLDSAADT